MPYSQHDSSMTTTADTLTIRRAGYGDGAALDRLAALDSAAPLRGDVLVAEAIGCVVAAISLRDGSVVADPFVPTADHVALLRARARRLAAGEDTRETWTRRVRRLLPA